MGSALGEWSHNPKAHYQCEWQWVTRFDVYWGGNKRGYQMAIASVVIWWPSFVTLPILRGISMRPKVISFVATPVVKKILLLIHTNTMLHGMECITQCGETMSHPCTHSCGCRIAINPMQIRAFARTFVTLSSGSRALCLSLCPYNKAKGRSPQFNFGHSWHILLRVFLSLCLT